MAVACTVSAPTFSANQALYNNTRFSKKLTPSLPSSPRSRVFIVRAAKLPSGVDVPRVQPKLSEPFLGFTKTAEIWNSRACMIGLIGTFIVELVLDKGILQMIGVEDQDLTNTTIQQYLDIYKKPLTEPAIETVTKLTEVAILKKKSKNTKAKSQELKKTKVKGTNDSTAPTTLKGLDDSS